MVPRASSIQKYASKLFNLANAVAASMYIVGFAETIRDILKEKDMCIFDCGLNDVRLFGLGK